MNYRIIKYDDCRNFKKSIWGIYIKRNEWNDPNDTSNVIQEIQVYLNDQNGQNPWEGYEK